MNQPPGWYADPFNREQRRCWDGKIWTMHVQSLGAADAAPPPGFGTAAPVSQLSVTTTQPVRDFAETSVVAKPPPVPGWTRGNAATQSAPLHRCAMFLSIAAAVLVVGGVGVGSYVVFGGHSSAAASEAIAKAVTQSLNEQTADMSLDIQVSAAGMNEHITGSGAFDFTTLGNSLCQRAGW
jgi:hypothetical protein